MLILTSQSPASNLTTNALFIPKIMEYTTSYKANDACRIGIVYTPETIEQAIMLKKNMQYKRLPKRKLIVKLIAYKQFTQRKAVSLDAVYLFTLKNQTLHKAIEEDVIVFGHKMYFLSEGALIYIDSVETPKIILNKKGLMEIHRSFTSAFLKIVEPYNG